MENFIDRTKELEYLENEYQSGRSSFVVVYGRRRTGKTALLRHFAKDKPSLYFLATEESESENRNAFAGIVAGHYHNSILASAKINDWEPVFDLIAENSKTQKQIIIIDEFQYIGKSSPAFISKLQAIWDNKLQGSNIMLILCGSLINMMYDQTLSYSSPLYGRRTGQIKLKQIGFEYYKDFFPSLTERERIERYAVTGGIPKYIETFSNNGDIFTDIEKNVLSGQSYLYEEPLFLLSKEVRDIGSYFSIIKTIASGRCKQGEIASALEIKNTNLPKYLNTLIELDIIEREVPVTESNPEKSKMGLYKIKDNFINFWFKFVYPNRSYLESGYTEAVMNKLKNSFISNHAAFVYEEICRNVCMRKMAAEGKFGFFPDKIGRWWDRKDTEIDIVAVEEEGRNIIFGECKYTNSPMDIDIYHKLLHKKNMVTWNRNDRNEKYVFFSINGYTERFEEFAKKDDNIILIQT